MTEERFAQFKVWAARHGFASEFVFAEAVGEIDRLRAENATLRKKVADLEESNQMGCESPPSGCDCSGCSYVREKNDEFDAEMKETDDGE